MRLLVVEDDRSIAEPLVDGLRRHGFDVVWVSTGADALNAQDADLVVLDLGLPDLDGQVVCRRIRDKSDVPIIVVTARADEIDRVTLLELGADDYVIKPFGFAELLARVRAVLRRASPSESSVDPTVPIEAGRIHIDRRRRVVSRDSDEVILTPKEYDLLLCLAEDMGAVLTRAQLMRMVWDDDGWSSSKTLDVHIASLRKKLGASELIETIRGVGYRLSDSR